MLGNLCEYLLEVAVLLRMVGLIGNVFDKPFHPFHAIAVKGFQNAQSSEEEGAGAAGRVKYGNFFDGMPESPQQLGTFGVDNGVPRKLPDVQVERNEVVDMVDFALIKPLSYVKASLAAGDMLTPSLRG